jgi:OmpA-OmpF porin, OOP family
MSVRFIILLCLANIGHLVNPTKLAGQNLVANPGFEQYWECPPNAIGWERKNYVRHWTSPTYGTPDYFNACANKAGVPYNWAGMAPAFEGNAYMGLIACMEQLDKNQIAYREYIRVKLTDSLRQGQSYYASMRVFLAQSSVMACNGLGMFFSNSDMASSIRHNYPVTPDIQKYGNPIIDTPDQWVQICGTFAAKGGEIYLIIGNFESDQSMKFRMFDPNLMEMAHNPMAYYYIDNVEVRETSQGQEFLCDAPNLKPFSGRLETNKPLVLANLLFNLNESVILPPSFAELDALVQLLQHNNTILVQISGYTDNLGQEAYNRQLSEQRAHAVKNYLLNRGIASSRINTRGMGSQIPVASNKTPDGQQLNRRVEIILTE